jgi:hypothetical protein
LNIYNSWNYARFVKHGALNSTLDSKIFIAIVWRERTAQC